MRFKKSKLYESAFTPIIIGLIVGFIAAIMGIVLLKEELKLYKIIGVSLIVVGAILITY